MSINLYSSLLRPLIFSGLRTDPEILTRRMIQTLGWLERRDPQFPVGTIHRFLEQICCVSDPRLEQKLWGITFPNPVGLAAGLDKDGIGAGVWSWLGFGFAEVGTVTAQAQPGNPRPRLFRLPQDRAAINRMGFNNRGAAALADQLKHLQDRHPRQIPLGINLGKSKATPLDQAAADYGYSFRLLKDLGDYFVVNVSSPNTPGLRSLQAAEQLHPILERIQTENQAQKPLLIKISPDLDWEGIQAVIQVAHQHHLAGIIATNTTLSRQDLKTTQIRSTGRSPQAEAGGLSGYPLRARSTEVIRFLRHHTDLPIIGVGGIFTAEDAWEKLEAGASLIQVYTGWTYEGPEMVKRILQGLITKLDHPDRSGISTLSDLSRSTHRSINQR